MSRTIVGAQNAYSQQKRRANEIDLGINAENTKVLTQIRTIRPAWIQNDITVDNIERVEQFLYLEVELCTDGENVEVTQKNNRRK